MGLGLNQRSFSVLDGMAKHAHDHRVTAQAVEGARVIDAGVHALGGLDAGILLARACMADLATIHLVPGAVGDYSCSLVQVACDHPVAACLGSQYAGWQVSVGKYFARASGPMRALAGREPLFAELGLGETADTAVGVLEAGKIPTPEVVAYLADRLKLPTGAINLAVAPTGSIAGSLQVVARSLETALHQMHEIHFPLASIVSGIGTAPLAPPCPDMVGAIGRTNDAILYGGRVEVFARAEDDLLAELGPRLPSTASPAHGKPFAEIFKEAGGDFYKIDPRLFAPGEIVLRNLATGRTHRFGRLEPDLVRRSFGG
jgi:methenyltetrahydromethanopterin cyclohydrolase